MHARTDPKKSAADRITFGIDFVISELEINEAFRGSTVRGQKIQRQGDVPDAGKGGQTGKKIKVFLHQLEKLDSDQHEGIGEQTHSQNPRFRIRREPHENVR